MHSIRSGQFRLPTILTEVLRHFGTTREPHRFALVAARVAVFPDAYAITAYDPRVRDAFSETCPCGFISSFVECRVCSEPATVREIDEIDHVEG